MCVSDCYHAMLAATYLVINSVPLSFYGVLKICIAWNSLEMTTIAS